MNKIVVIKEMPMPAININGKNYMWEEDMSLMTFLREHVGITSVKNGCSQGACGTCSVLVDGKPTRACILKLSKVLDKKIITVEGLSSREKDVYAFAFGEAGAVQCGFCIPGMVIAAKGLLNFNPNPTREDVQKAIQPNICRCTGYVKIENAILLAAELFNNNTPIIQQEGVEKVGASYNRIDAQIKTLGEAKYVDDIKIEGMVYGKAIRPPYARVKLISINTEKAMSIPGVVAIYTAEDIPGSRFIGHLQKDWPVMIKIGEETRYVGDAVALIVTEEKSLLDEASKLVEIEYEELAPLTNPKDALKSDAPQIHGRGFQQFGQHFVPQNNILSHQVLNRGNAEEALKKAEYISEHDFYTPFTEHAFMEPECAIGIPDGAGIEVISGGQGIYDEQREISEMLGLSADKVHIQSAYVGGGFGGKEDMSVQHHAALMAYLCRRPVKVLMTRDESIKTHPKRHAMYMHFKVGCDKEGNLLGMKAEIVSDTGAYSSLGGPVLQRACTHAAGPYHFQNVLIDGKAVFTNNPPAGAFRGFGVSQSCFAMEASLNELADMVGISAWEIRYKNAIRPGEALPNGQIADGGTAFVETLELCKEYYDKFSKKSGYYVGIASALKNAGLGVGVDDTGRCNLYIKDSKVHIRTSAADIGQGVQTIVIQIACEATGLCASTFVIDQPDTQLTPDSGTTTASRQTVFAGEAAREASLKLAHDLKTNSLQQLEGRLYEGEYTFVSDPMGSKKENPVSHVAYSYATQVAVIDSKGKVIETLAVHDAGTIINPKNVEGQIEGGTLMSMGYALTEDFRLKEGIPISKYGTLGLLRSTQRPVIHSILVEKNHIKLAYGAKGIGELSSVPFAPAIQGAYYEMDKEFRTSLPLNNTFYNTK